MLKKVKRKINNKFDLQNKTKKIKNLPANPKRGGIPAKDINDRTTKIENDWIPPTYFSSFKVFTNLISTKKKIVKILNNRIRYIVIFNKNKEYTYSFEISKIKLFK